MIEIHGKCTEHIRIWPVYMEFLFKEMNLLLLSIMDMLLVYRSINVLEVQCYNIMPDTKVPVTLP